MHFFLKQVLFSLLHCTFLNIVFRIIDKLYDNPTQFKIKLTFIFITMPPKPQTLTLAHTPNPHTKHIKHH